MNQSVKLGLDQGETRNMKIEIGVRQGFYLSPILFSISSGYTTKEALEGFGDIIKGCGITGE
jgi:hypothetical protein